MKFSGKKKNPPRKLYKQMDGNSMTTPDQDEQEQQQQQPPTTKKTKKSRKFLSGFRRRAHRRNTSAATANSDTDSTSKQSADEEHAFSDADDSQNEGAALVDPFHYLFRKNLQTVFQDGAHKTVLLSDAQMIEIRKTIAADYTEVLLHYTNLEEDGSQHQAALMELHLRCSSHLLKQFWDMTETILQGTMGLTNQEILFQSIEEYILPSITYQLHPINAELTPEARAMAITWIYNLENDMKRMAPEVLLRQDWANERKKLFEKFLDRAVTHKMTILLMEVLKLHSDSDIRTDADGQLVTGLPEQVSYVFNQELRVASECLPSEFTEDILMACNEALLGMIHDWMMRISVEWAQTSTDFLCATINDTVRLLEYCDERHDNYLTRPEVIQAAAEVSRHMAEFSLHTTKFVCERIMQDLREPEPTLDLVGTELWESPDGPSFVDCTVETFKDYFADVEGWLISDYYFPKVLKNCFDLTLQTYLEAFFVNTMERGVNDAATVAAELEQDYLRLAVFFNGEQFIAYHGCGGFYSQKTINDRLRVLQHMAALIDPTNLPTYLSFEVQQILRIFGRNENGEPAVLHLVGLRGHRRAHESLNWLKVIATAKKELAAQDETLGHFDDDLICKLPDLRNSKMIRKIRKPRRAGIEREISAGSRPFAESTARLLHQPTRFVAPPVLKWEYAQQMWRERSPQKRAGEPEEYEEVVETRESTIEEMDSDRSCEERVLAEF